MAITVALHHRTTYSYDRPVRLRPQVVRLRRPHRDADQGIPIGGLSRRPFRELAAGRVRELSAAWCSRSPSPPSRSTSGSWPNSSPSTRSTSSSKKRPRCTRSDTTPSPPTS
ncbi:MAG: transglutaminase N-terminal domain-containing protein [Ilumatobacteraceae bacterium]